MRTAVADRESRQAKPPTRAYVLLQSTGHKRNEAIGILRQQPGVVTVDPVEGPPDIVIVVEAPTRRKLASLLVRAMASVQDLTEDIELLPTQPGPRGRGTRHALK